MAATCSRLAPGRRQPREPGVSAAQTTAGMRPARSSRRRRSSSWFSSGCQLARTWPGSSRSATGSQRPRATRLSTQRCTWAHQRRSSPSSAGALARGRAASQRDASDGCSARAGTLHGHHSTVLGRASPAISGRPLLRLGRVSCSSMLLLDGGSRSCSCSQALRSPALRARGWICGASSPSLLRGLATRQVSAHRPRQGCGSLGSQTACSRLMAAAAGARAQIPSLHYGGAGAAGSWPLASLLPPWPPHLPDPAAAMTSARLFSGSMKPAATNPSPVRR